MPVQRILPYRFLLQDLLNATSKSYLDSNNVEGALARSKNFADYINKSKQNSLNRKHSRERFESADCTVQCPVMTASNTSATTSFKSK
jgi:hypothetical protein